MENVFYSNKKKKEKTNKNQFEEKKDQKMSMVRLGKKNM